MQLQLLLIAALTLTGATEVIGVERAQQHGASTGLAVHFPGTVSNTGYWPLSVSAVTQTLVFGLDLPDGVTVTSIGLKYATPSLYALRVSVWADDFVENEGYWLPLQPYGADTTWPLSTTRRDALISNVSPFVIDKSRYRYWVQLDVLPNKQAQVYGVVVNYSP